MRADGETDMTKLIVVFRNFANARKKGASSILTSMIQPLPVMKHPSS